LIGWVEIDVFGSDFEARVVKPVDHLNDLEIVSISAEIDLLDVFANFSFLAPYIRVAIQ